MTETIVELLTALKTAIQNGIDTEGSTVAGATVPDYGGTSTDEDFDGFYVYMANLNDIVDYNSIRLPAIIVTADLDNGSEELFDDEELSITFETQLFVTDVLGKADESGTEYTGNIAVNYFLNRLHEFYKKVNIPQYILARRISQPIESGNFLRDNELIFSGALSVNFEYVRTLEG